MMNPVVRQRAIMRMHVLRELIKEEKDPAVYVRYKNEYEALWQDVVMSTHAWQR